MVQSFRKYQVLDIMLQVISWIHHAVVLTLMNVSLYFVESDLFIVISFLNSVRVWDFIGVKRESHFELIGAWRV